MPESYSKMTSPFEIQAELLYSFTYRELKPLIDILWKEPMPEERHNPGINHVIDRLMQIKKENENVAK